MWWMGLALITAIGGAACAVVSAGMVRAMRRALDEKQRETDRRLSAMAATVETLQARVAELGGPATAQSAVFPAGNAAGQKQELAEAETVAVLAAAAATFIGKEVRVRSAQAMPEAQNGAGNWAQQGRAFVQTSHNPRSRG
jgi:hypothetical protein